MRTAIKALRWNYMGVGARTLSSFLIGILLARLLGPKPFGQVAIAWLVIGFGNLIADCGFGAALIQRRNLDREDVRFAFTLQVGLGLLISVSIAGLAPWIAWLFRQHDAAPVVRGLSAIFTLQAFGLTAVSLLKRELAFRRLQVSQVLSYLIAYLGLGVPLALRGFGVWSLVVAQLAQAAIYSMMAYLSVRHSIRPLLRSPHRDLTAFGGKAIGANVVNWLIGNGDNAIVGRVFGAISLGLYDRSLILMTTPMNGIVSTLQAVLFPTYSRAQSEQALLRRLYLTSVAMIQICVVPVFVIIAAVPATVIGGLYGSRWPAAVPLLIPFALARPFQALMALAGPLLWGVGKVERELRVQIAVAVVLVPALLIAARVSVVCVAWTIGAVLVLQCALMTRAAMRVVCVDGSTLARLLRGPLLLAAVGAPAVRLCDRYVFNGWPMTIRLTADAGSAILLLGLLVLLLPKVFLCLEILEFAQARHWSLAGAVVLHENSSDAEQDLHSILAESELVSGAER